MKPIDIAKSAGVGFLLLVVNVLLAFVVVGFYSIFINPGHETDYYVEAAKRIAPWSSHTVGTALFFAAGFLLTRRRSDRNGYLFAIAFTVWYAVIDAATVAFAVIFDIEFVLSVLAKLAASLVGAMLATRQGKVAAANPGTDVQNSAS